MLCWRLYEPHWIISLYFAGLDLTSVIVTFVSAVWKTLFRCRASTFAACRVQMVGFRNIVCVQYAEQKLVTTLGLKSIENAGTVHNNIEHACVKHHFIFLLLPYQLKFNFIFPLFPVNCQKMKSYCKNCFRFLICTIYSTVNSRYYFVSVIATVRNGGVQWKYPNFRLDVMSQQCIIAFWFKTSSLFQILVTFYCDTRVESTRRS